MVDSILVSVDDGVFFRRILTLFSACLFFSLSRFKILMMLCISLLCLILSCWIVSFVCKFVLLKVFWRFSVAMSLLPDGTGQIGEFCSSSDFETSTDFSDVEIYPEAYVQGVGIFQKKISAKRFGSQFSWWFRPSVHWSFIA